MRTVRLVAGAVARHAGVVENRLDEVRLAVGEACSRAVRRCQAADVQESVVVDMDDAGPAFVVVVTDTAPGSGEDEPIGVAMMRRLADEADFVASPSGAAGVLRLAWARSVTG